MPVYKIAIAGASTLLSRELKDVLSESPLAASNFALLDEQETQGQLEQVGDEVTFIQVIGPEAFERADFTFFCGSESLTRRYWQQALRSGSTVLDLSGALDQEAGVLIRAPWLETEAAVVDLFTPAVVPAHPAVIAIALLLQRLQQVAPVRFAAATVLEPASEFGRVAMDELHQQTVNLLNFQAVPQGIYDAQIAFNLLGGMGEEAKVSLPSPSRELLIAKRILVADDNSLIRQTLSKLFESEGGYEICGEAKNGQEAIDLAMQRRPDLIILDWAMPILNGLDL